MPPEGRAVAVRGHRFGVDPKLDRETARPGQIGAAQARVRERMAGGEQELSLDQIDAGDFFGHGVLDLQARIRLDKRELGVVAAVRIDQELEGAEIVVAHALGDADCGVGQTLAQRRR